MSLFVPYRKQRGRPPVDEVRRAAELAEATRNLGAVVATLAIAMDVLPERGALSFRDAAGKVWCITIAASDVDKLICESPTPP